MLTFFLVRVGELSAGVRPGQRCVPAQRVGYNVRRGKGSDRILFLVLFTIKNPDFAPVSFENQAVGAAKFLQERTIRVVLLFQRNVHILGIHAAPQPVPVGNGLSNALDGGLFLDALLIFFVEARSVRTGHRADGQHTRPSGIAEIVHHQRPAVKRGAVALHDPVFRAECRVQHSFLKYQMPAFYIDILKERKTETYGKNRCALLLVLTDSNVQR